jgi:ribose transport system ATP-binding protein
VGKTYAEPVLADVTLTLAAGEVLALTGENGAGKSTLSKIIGGLVEPTTGTMQLGGDAYAPASRTQAEALGVRMVMQELNLLPTLTVAENLFLNRCRGASASSTARGCAPMRGPRWRRSGSTRSIPTRRSALGIGHQQMVEIARNLIGDCRVLILDEPTAMLTAREVELLFEQIDRLKARGVAIVYISHRLEELARVAERVAVLRDGRLVHVGDMAAISADGLVTLMVGRELGEHRSRRAPDRAPRLVVSGMTRGTAVQDVSLEVRAGEIFGISGLIGAGRTELLRLIYGADTPDTGMIAVGEPPQPVRIQSPVDAVAHGIALITEDRKGEGLLLTQSVASNVSLGQLAGSRAAASSIRRAKRRSPSSRSTRCGSARTARRSRSANCRAATSRRS